MKNLKDNPDAGFSLLEVVVAIVMVFFFTNVALQMIILSSLFKKKATQYTTAISLIQQDMEKIKSAADQYSFPTISSAANATTVTLSSLNGFPLTNTTTDQVIFSNSPKTYTISGINQNTKAITISPALQTQTTTAAAAAVGATTVTLTSTDGLAANNKVKFSNNFTNTYTISSISNYNITISPALTTATPALTGLYMVSTSAINNTSCNLTFTDTASTSKIATYLMNSLPTTATGIGTTAYTVDGTAYYAVTGTPTLVKGQYYWLLRNQTVSSDGNDAPYNILKLRYVVQEGNATNPNSDTYIAPLTSSQTPLTTSSIEVIPYASLQCPSQ
jgi:type II secretory pathway pseudopilin PulG